MRLCKHCLAFLPLGVIAADIEHAGDIVSSAGNARVGRYEIIDAFVPNSGGLVTIPDGSLSISLNQVFELYKYGDPITPIDIDSITVSFRWLSDGALFVELDEADWELVYSQDLQPDSWKEVTLGAIFQTDGNGWRIEKTNIPDSIFLRARLK